MAWMCENSFIGLLVQIVRRQIFSPHRVRYIHNVKKWYIAPHTLLAFDMSYSSPIRMLRDPLLAKKEGGGKTFFIWSQAGQRGKP